GGFIFVWVSSLFLGSLLAHVFDCRHENCVFGISLCANCPYRIDAPLLFGFDMRLQSLHNENETQLPYLKSSRFERINYETRPNISSHDRYCFERPSLRAPRPDRGSSQRAFREAG